MESKKDSSSLPTRVTRGSRGAKTTVSLRTKPEEKTSSENPPKTNTEKKETKNEKKESVSRSPPKGRGKNRTLQHRNRRQGPVNNRRNRLERAQNATNKSENKKNVEKFNNRRYYGTRRRRIGLREIFIAGLPRNVDSRRLFNLLKNEGRVIRCTVLKNSYGYSRGIAFAEFQNSRDSWKVINKWKGRKIGRFTIYVAFKRKNRYGQKRNYYGGNFRKYRGNYGRGRFNQNQRNFGNRGSFIPRYRGRGRGNSRGN